MDTLKTKIHYYRFRLWEEDERVQYEALCQPLKDKGLKCFASIAANHSSFYREKIKPLDGQEITLELKHVFNNQWNTGPTETSESGLRVFDWAEPIYENKQVKEGMWLEQTPEMQEVRDNTNACGYCGYQTRAQRGDVFCPMCLDSEYLKESELHLTRMQAVSNTKSRVPLTQAEKEHLLSKFKEAQIFGSTERGKKRIAALREKLETEYNVAVESAQTKHDGFIWLLDQGINTSNCIYYQHTDVFSFGWRKPLGEAELSTLLDVISEFPFAYEIKCQDGRKLEGY